MSTTIESFGTTSLVEDGSNYFLYPDGELAVELMYAGSPVVAGQFIGQSGGAWAPIGVEQTADGYEVAWQLTGTDQFSVWYTDSSGNYLSNALSSVSGTDAALQSFETSFQQDLNGDGTIGVPSQPPAIENFGSTSLVQNGSNYFLEPDGGSAVELSYAGSPVVAGQFGTWVPIGVEQTANGYEVAWQLTGTDQFSVWYTDSSGNYLSNALSSVSGTDAALQSFETSFQQDLNGDGTVGVVEQASSPQFVYQGVDASGAQLYSVTWDTSGLQPFTVRVLVPENPSSNYPHSFLYTLPVEAGLAQSTFGSGLDELQNLNVQNQYNATIIEPIFPIDPWYADSATDPTVDYETFMATILPAWVESNFATSGTEENLLIGFSKSGYGGLDLLFKHPTVFDAIAAWDFPADMTTYSQYGGNSSYGTDANFLDNYQLTASFIDTWKVPFTTEDRIWISGYAAFQTDIADFNALLTSEGVAHTLSPQTYNVHAWYGGWLPNAVAGLYGLVELSLQQDLNGDGTIGPPLQPPAIESFGTTSLIADGSNYLLQAVGGAAVELSYAGAPVVAGQFVGDSGGIWEPIGAEQTADGYEVAWKLTGADQFTVWYTDSSGNYVSNAIDVVSGSSDTLQSFETSFQQDLNGDGSIGPPSQPPAIENFGSTSLVQNGSNYFLEPDGGSAIELSYAGAPVVAGQFISESGGIWAPIGAEQTADGYEVAWQVTGADQFAVWYTDSGGNYVSNALVTVSGTDAALQSFETSFQQDLNGDGWIGPPPVIESFGTTSLIEDGSNYFLQPDGGSAVELSFVGDPVVAGQFISESGGTWAPIGAEQTADGYEVAWQVTGADQFSVWYTDSSGNYDSNALATVSGTDAALQSFETSFQQDLNGDGTIGPSSQPPAIESFGTTSLVENGSNYFLQPDGGSAVELSFAGSPVVAGQFISESGGTWAPIGAEQTADGYEVAWQVTGADQFSVWYTDNSGNYVSNALAAVSGSDAALQSFETSFQQDLNGDGTIGHFIIA